MMSKLLNAALAAALGFVVSAPVYAADTSQTSQAKRSPGWTDAERAAMDKCHGLTATPEAKCIVNVRPTPAEDKVAMTPGSSAEGGTVKDGSAATEAEYAAAVKECESANAADKDRCVNTAKEHFGRM
jgi:hypothetical protein